MKHNAGIDVKKRAIAIIDKLRIATKNMEQPAATQIVNKYGRDPFLILVSCILSLRTRDTVSFPASLRLFEYAKSPEQLLGLSPPTIEKLIYPVGFYHQKTKQLCALSAKLIAQYNSTVPNNEADLLSLPGVGRKTMNLVLSEAFGIPALCVDTHVHRISNRLGLVATDTPEKTEKALKLILEPEYWSEYNKLMVMWGQNICLPLSPLCSQCPLLELQLCPQIGVTRRR